ncbi:ankyrin repeat domain-containing protein [Dysgonomonas massiliensis]|uniref:ankyrin repeat domain-containing protein n=1 Tax=Dysgonomonas massiliensis TaxID=2040292 RepID=UPI000C77CB3E|nr:ankyrin repeat domain-containing protein [Dysgonomonas massiliensis]
MKKVAISIFLLLICLYSYAHKERWDENRDSWSPLMIAIYNSQTATFLELIKQDADVNFKSGNENTGWELTALDVAIRKDSQIAVKALLNTNKVLTPEIYLMTACAQNSAQNVELLIKYGANPNETLDNGYSVLMKAASFGSSEVLEVLLKHGAKTNQKRSVDGITALMLAAFNGEPQKVKLLLKYGANKYTKDNNGKTALEYVEHIYERLNISESTKGELRSLLK